MGVILGFGYWESDESVEEGMQGIERKGALQGETLGTMCRINRTAALYECFHVLKGARWP